MREIKFRAYHHTSGFRYFDLHYVDAGSVLFDDGDWHPLKDCEVSQYTGLKDKNGREIWEGDVCKASYVCHACFDSDPHILTGEITKDSFGTWMFDFGHGAMAVSYFIMDEGNDIEVIGNVYENPNLVSELSINPDKVSK